MAIVRAAATSTCVARDFAERTFCNLDSRITYAAADIGVVFPTDRSVEEIALVAGAHFDLPPPAYAGTDFIIARDGKIAAVYLFFDKLP